MIDPLAKSFTNVKSNFSSLPFIIKAPLIAFSKIFE